MIDCDISNKFIPPCFLLGSNSYAIDLSTKTGNWKLGIHITTHSTFPLPFLQSLPLPCHTNFTSPIVLPPTILSNPINSIFSFHPMSPYYNISYTCSSSPFISSLPLLQYNHQSIQSLLFYHTINVLYLPSILSSFSSLSLLPYQQFVLYKPLPIKCFPHHFSFFLPSLHSIFLYPPSNLPFYNHSISFNHIHHPLLYAPLPYHAYVSHILSIVPRTAPPQL